MSTEYRTGRHVYFAQDATDPRALIKIGASNDPPLRVRSLTREIGRPIMLLGVIHDATHRGERAIHHQWDECRILAPDLPTTEWFTPTLALRAFIREVAEEYRPKVKEAFIPNGECWVKAREVAEFLRWPIHRVYVAVRERRIPHYRLTPTCRGHLRFKLSQLAHLRPAA